MKMKLTNIPIKKQNDEDKKFKRRKSTILGFVPDPLDACSEVGKIKRDRNNARRHIQKKRRWIKYYININVVNISVL